MCTSSVRGGCVVGWSQAREAKELKFVERQLYEDSCPMNKEDERVSDWENQQLPAPEELMPLTQTLITPHLASAFSIITQEPAPSPLVVHLPTQFTLVALPTPGNFSSSSTEAHPLTLQNVKLGGGPSSRSERVAGSGESHASFREFRNSNKDATLQTGLSNDGSSAPQYGSSPCYADNSPVPNGLSYGALERRVENGYGGGITGTESSEYGGAKKPRKQLDVEFEDADSALGLENSGEEPTVRTLKRPRLVWTPQLHKRFVDAVAHLGIKNAVPKTIMQLMNVEGLTRENVASHLQKYRLYLKRISTEGPSVSDHLFASTPVPPSLAASAHFLSNHRDNMVPLLLPLQIGSLGHGRVVGPLSAAATYASCDPFFSLARSSDQRLPSGDQVFVLDNSDRPGSPQRRILTLFPTKGH